MKPLSSGDSELKKRYLGLFLGCAVGDALGAPLEGRPIPAGLDRDQLLEDFKQISGWPKGQYTDDTMLTLALARSIAEHRGVAGGHVIAEFAKLWREGTIVGAGAATNEAIANYLYKHKPWDQCGAPLGRAGNGAAMRAGPIGLWYFDDIDELIPAAVEASEVTHRDPRSIAAAVVVALVVARSIQTDRLEPVSVLREVADRVLRIDPGTSDHVMRLADWMEQPDEVSIELIISTGQFGPWRGTWNGRITAYAVPTLLMSLYSFLRYQDSFNDAVALAILTGGDVDTTGAITGALSGALLGDNAIPKQLREGVLSSAEIKASAVRFFESRFSTV